MVNDINDLKKRLSDIKKDVGIPESLTDIPPDNEKEKSDLGRAYEMIATPIVCGGIGAGLDHLFSTSPLFFITLATLGLLAGFWAIYKASQNIATPLDSKRLQDDEKQVKTGANFRANNSDD